MMGFIKILSQKFWILETEKTYSYSSVKGVIRSSVFLIFNIYYLFYPFKKIDCKRNFKWPSPGKDGNVRFTTLMLCQECKCKCLQFYQLIILSCSYHKKVTCRFLLQENIKKLLELNTFKPGTTKISFTILKR